MSGTIVEDSQDQVHTDCTIKNDGDGEGAFKDMINSDVGDENAVPSPEEEEEIIKKKYGGLLPKRPSLISKDHEHAFFDSADWALGKQGAQKPKGPLEALRPKLQPTPHHQGRSRRSAYAPADDGNEGNGYHSEDPEDESHKVEDGSEKDLSSEEKSCQDEPRDVLLC
ncbi:hypothetical protein BT93_L3216 [Corymbia citriodora subsp. variegata]|uniref:Negatively light-regulated protein n=1 Tax=Corymbia citriodora subsp. variegata TaxID=360336 RepID=A0A8T0CZD3_CORYI|nr:hypothetical protein BT93_L3216 [Corymbia citriodora subsp. variegata]